MVRMPYNEWQASDSHIPERYRGARKETLAWLLSIRNGGRKVIAKRSYRFPPIEITIQGTDVEVEDSNLLHGH
jgi:hypothetical protein